MRIKIKEQIDAYNERHPDAITMRDVALGAYSDEDTIEQTKINRISALNTGRTMATIRDLVRIAGVLDCEPTELIEK